MVVYTAHFPAGTAPRSDADAEKVVFVKDGFAWGALVLSFIWLFANRCWIAALAVLAITVILGVAGEYYPQFADALGAIGLLFSILVAFEANGWRRWSLARKGYDFLGVAAGANLAECERRFFENWIDNSGSQAVVPAPRPAMAVKMSGAPGIVGMFPEGGR